MARLGVRSCDHSRASRSGGIDGGGGGEGGVVVKKRTAELLRFCWRLSCFGFVGAATESIGDVYSRITYTGATDCAEVTFPREAFLLFCCVDS